MALSNLIRLGQFHLRAKSAARQQRSMLRQLVCESLEDRRLLSVSTSGLTTGLTAIDLATMLVGPGVTISNATYTGALSAGGIFSGALSESLGIDSGVVLSSGRIDSVIGPNDSDGTSNSFGTPGDADLNSLIGTTNTLDAAVSEFDFVAVGGTVSFQYVFGSEEYNE